MSLRLMTSPRDVCWRFVISTTSVRSWLSASLRRAFASSASRRSESACCETITLRSRSAAISCWESWFMAASESRCAWLIESSRLRRAVRMLSAAARACIVATTASAVRVVLSAMSERALTYAELRPVSSALSAAAIAACARSTLPSVSVRRSAPCCTSRA